MLAIESNLTVLFTLCWLLWQQEAVISAIECAVLMSSTNLNERLLQTAATIMYFLHVCFLWCSRVASVMLALP